MGVARRSMKLKDFLLLGNNMIIPRDMHWNTNDIKVDAELGKVSSEATVCHLDSVFVSLREPSTGIKHKIFYLNRTKRCAKLA